MASNPGLRILGGECECVCVCLAGGGAEDWPSPADVTAPRVRGLLQHWEL